MNEVNDLLDQMEVILHNIQAIRRQHDVIRGLPTKIGGGTKSRWRNDFTGI